MGKNKNKDEIPNPNSVTNRDILQRLNFLYQASVLLNGITLTAPSLPSVDDNHDGQPPPQPEGAVESGSHSGKAPRRRRVVTTSELSRSYVDTMKSVGQKTNVKLDPSVKRLICKGCSSVLVPGVSATVRIKNSMSHGHLISYKCHRCQTERRIPAPPVLHAEPQAGENMLEVQVAEASGSSAPDTTAGGPVRRGRQKRKKKPPVPRLPPHFARDIGHVVFRGNERLIGPDT
ncbi:Rpr2-domain-containing protein [Melanogaster broomeanus]|nr:Rpr2-domain-containing protein [Melanogaster broomeanus]